MLEKVLKNPLELHGTRFRLQSENFIRNFALIPIAFSILGIKNSFNVVENNLLKKTKIVPESN